MGWWHQKIHFWAHSVRQIRFLKEHTSNTIGNGTRPTVRLFAFASFHSQHFASFAHPIKAQLRRATYKIRIEHLIRKCMKRTITDELYWAWHVNSWLLVSFGPCLFALLINVPLNTQQLGPKSSICFIRQLPYKNAFKITFLLYLHTFGMEDAMGAFLLAKLAFAGHI